MQWLTEYKLYSYKMLCSFAFLPKTILPSKGLALKKVWFIISHKIDYVNR